jgi:hypothetical protein
MPRTANATSFKTGNRMQAKMIKGPDGKFVTKAPVAPLQWTDCDAPSSGIALYNDLRRPQIQFPEPHIEKDSRATLAALGTGAVSGLIVIGGLVWVASLVWGW